MKLPRLSRVGDRFNSHSGTRALMDDLGAVQRDPGAYLNLGGGNPARVPAMHAWFSERLATLARSAALDDAFAAYEDPQGPLFFREAVAGFLARHQGWPVDASHVLCTAGSQASFFMLFNLLAGPTREGVQRRIVLPQCPEYIGYEGQGLAGDMLSAVEPRPVETTPRRFRYQMDFAALRADAHMAALCLSRPCNPTGNVCRDEDLARLASLAEAAEVPLIVDCAYGEPFPGITFVEHTLPWSSRLIACFSLSKLGLPGLRVGVIVAAPELIRVLTNMNTSMLLAPNPLGCHLAAPLFQSDELKHFVEQEIRPFYAGKARFALACCDRELAGLDYLIHEAEGAIFLWLWLRGLPITAQELYERLKARGVLIIPGHHFAPGREHAPAHLDQCIRLSFAQPEETVSRGIAIVAEEVRKAWARR
ncbi:MAG: Aspartate aminotransferase [Pseudomonadota bacterium]